MCSVGVTSVIEGLGRWLWLWAVGGHCGVEPGTSAARWEHEEVALAEAWERQQEVSSGVGSPGRRLLNSQVRDALSSTIAWRGKTQ